MKIKFYITLILIFCLTSFLGCKFIINKFAFYPDNKNIIPKDKLPVVVQDIFIETEDKIKIQCYFIPHKTSDKILIFFHGNAGNISHRLPDIIQFHSFGINILAVSYRGYGKSQGKPSEAGIYLDGKAAFDYATEKLGFHNRKIIIFGRSIGTTVAINTACNKNISGLILVSPLTSGKEHAKGSGLNSVSSIAGNSFNNISKISNIKCPLLVIHGTKDRVIPFSMGKAIYNKATVKKQFITIEDGGHNNLSNAYNKEYWQPINEFIKQL